MELRFAAPLLNLESFIFLTSCTDLNLYKMIRFDMILKMKQVTEFSIENQFFKGHFDRVIKTNKTQSTQDLAYLIGSYCMTNRSDQGEQIFKKHHTALLSEKDHYVLSLFFLGLGTTRDSEYKKAKNYFLLLFRQRKNTFHDYLLQQGLGFYNFFICRYQMAEFWIQKNQILLQNISIAPFWNLIHLDLSAHIAIKRGRIQQGFQFIENALQIARKIENQFVVEALTVSKLNYESLYGLDQKNSFAKLKDLIKKYSQNKNFYYYNLSLEMIRRLNLNGELTNAEIHLRKIEKDLFLSPLQRQKALWGFRFAHLLYLQGKLTQSLNQIESAFDYLDQKQDLSLQVQILGLKYKILKIQGRDIENIKQAIQRITFYCKDAQSLSYAYRNGWHNKPVTEDPYAQFFHSWKRGGHKNYSSLKNVLNKDWVSLFVDLLPADRVNFIYLDILPKIALVFTDSGISIAGGTTPLIRQSLLLLSRQNLSKKQFVEYLWGYEYDSYRHDTLVYTLIGRLREFLGPNVDLLKMQDNIIELVQTQVRVYDHHELKPEVSLKDLLTTTENRLQNLNFRQIELIDYLGKNPFIGALQASEILHVPKITACRDLADLLKQKLITKSGKARATRYSLAQI